jgi:hypothetical protein
MNTNDPDRCPEGCGIARGDEHAVAQCQGSINHEGRHFFAEDHYTIRWHGGDAPLVTTKGSR